MASTDPVRAVPSTSPDVYCQAVNGISWTLYREKCYHHYSAPFGVEGASQEEYDKHYKTWFEAREECAKLGAKLASVHDQATHEKLLQLIAGNETVTSPEETTWIGLQVGTPSSGCYWPAGVCPRLKDSDPDLKNTVDKCRITYDDTFHGQWEDGERYNETESADFWGPHEPSYLSRRHCNGDKFEADEWGRAYCERGVSGQPDRRRHCAQIVPADSKQIPDEEMKPYAGKWADYWCWIKSRGYICERPAMRSDESEDYTTATIITSGGVEAQSCATAWLDACAKRALERIDEIELEINATRTGNSVVMETIALGNAAAGKTWLGGSTTFADLAHSAVEFGRNIAKLSSEECLPDSRGLRLQLQDLAKKMMESYENVEMGLKASSDGLLANVRDAAFSNSYRYTYKQLTSLGVCAQFNNVSEQVLTESSKRAIQALSKVNDAFKRALQNDTPAVPFMNQAAIYIKNKYKEELGVKRWSEREELHQEIVNGTVDALKNHTRKRYVFNAVAALPDNLTDQQCHLFPKNNFVDVSYRDLNYFILHANERALLFPNEARDKVKNNTAARNAVLNLVFAKSNEDLCERLASALNANGVDIKKFGGVAAVKCGYEFVWFELGYTYFYAAYSSTKYQWAKKGGAYDAKCGQIFFFP